MYPTPFFEFEKNLGAGTPNLRLVELIIRALLFEGHEDDVYEGVQSSNDVKRLLDHDGGCQAMPQKRG